MTDGRLRTPSPNSMMASPSHLMAPPSDPDGASMAGAESDMWRPIVARKSIEIELAAGWRRSRALVPFSPAWDAAMAAIEDLERELWRMDLDNRGPGSDGLRRRAMEPQVG